MSAGEVLEVYHEEEVGPRLLLQVDHEVKLVNTICCRCQKSHSTLRTS